MYSCQYYFPHFSFTYLLNALTFFNKSLFSPWYFYFFFNLGGRSGSPAPSHVHPYSSCPPLIRPKLLHSTNGNDDDRVLKPPLKNLVLYWYTFELQCFYNCNYNASIQHVCRDNLNRRYWNMLSFMLLLFFKRISKKLLFIGGRHTRMAYPV